MAIDVPRPDVPESDEPRSLYQLARTMSADLWNTTAGTYESLSMPFIKASHDFKTRLAPWGVPELLRKLED
jgi:hypothetical protein